MPPVPWRKLVVWGLVAAVAIGIVAAIAVPKIDSAKEKGAAERAAQSAALDNAERARLRADQRVHRVSVPVGAAAVGALEAAITADAKARVVAKTIDGKVSGTNCSPAASDIIQFPHSRVYKCFVATSGLLHGEGSDLVKTGYPFVATIYAAKHVAAWCKENPHADEKGTHGDVRVKVSPVCAGKLSQVL